MRAPILDLADKQRELLVLFLRRLSLVALALLLRARL